MTVYLAINHPPMSFTFSGRPKYGVVERVFANRKDAKDFVDDKNKRAKYNLWSVLAKKVDGKTEDEK